MRGNLPTKETAEWKAEVDFFLQSDSVARGARAISLGYSCLASYTTAMERRGIYLTRQVPVSKRRRYNRPLIIREDCLVIFDTQVPYHDAEFLNNLLNLAHTWGIKQGVSGGDLLNMTAFSIFQEHAQEKLWIKEREEDMAVLLTLQKIIPKWLLVKGNHEAFLLKALAEQLGHEDILRLLNKPDGFTTTDYYYCKVILGGSVWRITHPRNISVIHGRIPQRLCEKYHSNIASGHGHLAGMTPDYSGKYIACDVGVTCDPTRLDYVSLRDTTRPAMCQGALILKLGKDNCCYPYHIYPSADFTALRRLYDNRD